MAEIIEFINSLVPVQTYSAAFDSRLQSGSAYDPAKLIVLSPFPFHPVQNDASVNDRVLLITAHPLFSEKFLTSTLRSDHPTGAILEKLIRQRTAVYTLPISLTEMRGGMDDALAEELGLTDITILFPTGVERMFKLALFVPINSLDEVRRAAGRAGAGTIGGYTFCSFEARGIGTFLPSEQANPFIGQVGKMEHTEEARLELRVTERNLQNVIKAALAAHPYEEAAYDIYEIKNPGNEYGRGRVGALNREHTIETLVSQINSVLKPDAFQQPRCWPSANLEVDVLAVCSGYGVGEDALFAAKTRGVSTLVTGGCTPQDQYLAQTLGIVLIDIGFSPSVMPGLQRIASLLREKFEDMEIVCAGQN